MFLCHLQDTYICTKHFPTDVVLDWKKNPSLEPFPAISRTVQKQQRKRPLNRNGGDEIDPLQNIAEGGANTYLVGEKNEKRPNVKEVYVCPDELQGIS